MNCDEMEDLLSAYADGQASPEEERIVSRHLEGCKACQRQLRWLKGAKSAVQRVAAPAMPRDLRAALMREAARHRPERGLGLRLWLTAPWRIRPLRYGLATAIAAAAVLIAVRQWAGRGEELSIETMLAAHNEYAMTKPLAPREMIALNIPEQLEAGGFDER